MKTIGPALVFMAVLSPAFLSGSTSYSNTQLHTQEVVVVTTDSLELHAWITPSPDVHAPLYVLLPMMGNTHESYSALIENIHKSFGADTSRPIPYIVTLDMRGHGESVNKVSKTGISPVSYREMGPENFARYPDDVKAVIDRVLLDKSLRIRRDKFVIIGASVGANTAAIVASGLKPIHRVVLLSPGEDYRGLRPADHIARFEGEVLIVVGDDDKYSRESSEKLAAIDKESCTLKIYPTAAHGTALLNENSDAMEFILDWLRREP